MTSYEAYIEEACVQLLHPFSTRECLYAIGDGDAQDTVYAAMWYWEFWDVVDEV
jgi:hypothetical protein